MRFFSKRAAGNTLLNRNESTSAVFQGFSRRFLSVAMSARESGSSALRSSMVDWFQVTKSVSKRVPFPLIILLVLLAAPSLYLFLKFPPLWRDSDGFYQVYAGNGEFTILHWPPLYCFLARIPIALGAIIRALAAGQAFPGFQILPHTNTSVTTLLPGSWRSGSSERLSQRYSRGM